jgi:predicted ATPase
MSHPFGDLLRQYCARKQGLSQTRLAHMVGYDQAILARMGQGGKDLTGPSGRERVVSIIAALRAEGVLTTQGEANALLKVAGMPPLFDGQPYEAALIRSLCGGSAATAGEPGGSAATPLSPVVHFIPPTPLTPLIGRENEVSELVELLAPGPLPGAPSLGVRLITLTGAGGSGKTRLALEVAHRLESLFPHGACFVELAPVQQAGDVSPAIVRALDVPMRPNVPALGALKQFLSNKTLLLALDNFEHLLDAAGAVTELLMAAPGVQVITTSREPLRVTGEHLFAVEPLEIDAAVKLFAQRARAAKPAFKLQGVEDVVAEICRRVDCLPLAIELAAATARRFTPRVLLAKLASLDVLADGPRDAPARHRTLRNAIEWSYALLTRDEQRVFRALGLFAGGAEVSQLQQVVEATGDSAATPQSIPDLPSILESLADKNLIRAEEQPDGSARYQLLEMIRAYALDKLADASELVIAHRAHAIAFCDLAEEAEPHIHDREQKYWVPRLEREHDNIRAALSWSLAPAGDPQLGLRLASRTWLFWWVRHFREGYDWLRKVLDRAGPQSSPFTLGRAYLGCGVLGTAIAGQGMIKALEEAMRLLQRVNDEEGVAFALYILGIFHPADERLQELIHEGMTLDRWQGNRIGMEWAIYNYLHNLHFMDAYQGNIEMIDNVIASASARGDMQLLALALNDKCFAALFANDLPRARALAERALGAARAIGVSWEETLALYWLGEILELMGDLDGAQHCMEECLCLVERYGWLDRTKATPFSILGKVARDRGDYDVARSYFQQSLKASEVDDMWWGLEGLSCVATAQNQHVRAARLLGAAEADRERRKDPWWEKDRVDLALYIARSRTALGDAAYEAAYAEGRAMSLVQAKAYAQEK